MKKAIKALWHGIKAVFTVLVEWIATLFGMKDESKYSRILRRILGTAVTAIAVLWAVALIIRLGQNICWRVGDRHNSSSDIEYDVQQLSDNVYFHSSEYSYYGFLADSNERKIMDDITWIARPLEGDSLVCYSNGSQRGYFNVANGQTVIKPSYDHAWVFSNGLAAVEKNNRILFIDTKGNTAIDRNFAYRSYDDGYVFHQGHCAVRDSTGQYMGLIDTHGDWVVAPRYENITPVDSFWHVQGSNEEAILSFAMDTIMPFANIPYEFYDTLIVATLDDNTLNAYSLKGELVCRSMIRDVEKMMYETDEVLYHVDKDGNEYSDDYYSFTPTKRIAVATCMSYEAAWGWYGLMTPDGRPLTPPAYRDIKAIGKDLYLCQLGYGISILLNSKGKRVE